MTLTTTTSVFDPLPTSRERSRSPPSKPIGDLNIVERHIYKEKLLQDLTISMACANTQCWAFVHSEFHYGAFCCGKCLINYRRHQRGARQWKKLGYDHGPYCEYNWYPYDTLDIEANRAPDDKKYDYLANMSPLMKHNAYTRN